MYLSVAANYEIRRMLKEHVDCVGVAQSRSLRVSESVNLNHLLMKLYPRKFEVRSKVRNLEILADLYRQASGNRSSRQTAQAELCRQIFRILGIRFGMDEVRMPSIVSETEVDLVPFFCGGQVREGLLYHHKFYGKIDLVKLDDCAEFHQLSIVMAEHEVPCLITRSPDSCSLWVGLRSPVYTVFLKDGIGAMRRALALYSVLCRFKQAKFAVY